MFFDVAPTITVEDADEYRKYIERVAGFALRLHIDASDGIFAPQKLLPLDQIWWPGGIRADIHVMYKQPFVHVELFKSLAPQLVIVHAEAEGDFLGFADELHKHGIEVGVALLPQTSIETVVPALDHIDHVLIFSGDLGHYGGSVDLSLLQKVDALRDLKPTLEIGWDGGITANNAIDIIKGGVDVLNVGGYIHNAANPAQAHATLETLRVTEP